MYYKDIYLRFDTRASMVILLEQMGWSVREDGSYYRRGAVLDEYTSSAPAAVDPTKSKNEKKAVSQGHFVTIRILDESLIPEYLKLTGIFSDVRPGRVFF